MYLLHSVICILLHTDNNVPYKDYVSSEWWTISVLMLRLLTASLWSALLVSRPPQSQMNPKPYVCSWQVDIKNQGKTALQVAAHQGHMEVVKALLQANSSIEVKDEDGDTALHYTAFGLGHSFPPRITWFISAQRPKMHLWPLLTHRLIENRVMM